MATVNVNLATTLWSPAFLMSAVLIGVGSLLAQVVTYWMRMNVRDINMKGGHAVCSVVASLPTLTILPGQFSRPIALGSTLTTVGVGAKDLGVV